MGELGMITLLGRAATDANFYERLCEYLRSRNREKLERFLLTTTRVSLSKKEMDYLLEEKRDICRCLKDLRNCLQIEYVETTPESGDYDPKRS